MKNSKIGAFCMAACAALVLSACSQQDVKSDELRLVIESQLSNSSFESVVHYQYLWDGNIKIAKVSDADISPSGNYAVYSNLKGRIMLYKYGSLQPKDITPNGSSFAEQFSWDEDTGKVIIIFRDGKKTSLSMK